MSDPLPETLTFVFTGSRVEHPALGTVPGRDEGGGGAARRDPRGGMPQLQAATRLARLRQGGGTSDTDALRQVYESFTEGLDTPHLAEARAVLEAAGARVG